MQTNCTRQNKSTHTEKDLNPQVPEECRVQSAHLTSELEMLIPKKLQLLRMVRPVNRQIWVPMGRAPVLDPRAPTQESIRKRTSWR